MSEHYSASAPPPEATSSADDLTRLVWQDADSRLQARLATLRESAERIREHDQAQDSELPEWLRDAFERITGAEDASLVFASLHRRVHEGFLTWDALYQHPSQQDGGMMLIGEALRHGEEQRQQTLALLREQRAAELD